MPRGASVSMLVLGLLLLLPAAARMLGEGPTSAMPTPKRQLRTLETPTHPIRRLRRLGCAGSGTYTRHLTLRHSHGYDESPNEGRSAAKSRSSLSPEASCGTRHSDTHSPSAVQPSVRRIRITAPSRASCGPANPSLHVSASSPILQPTPRWSVLILSLSAKPRPAITCVSRLQHGPPAPPDPPLSSSPPPSQTHT